MAAYEDHPHYQLEARHLKQTVAALERYIERHTPVRGQAADQKTAHAVWNVQAKLVQDAQDALQDLYFGRVDWQRGALEGREAFYIGITPFLGGDGDPQILAWQDTLAGDLYYQLATEREHGLLLLKRAIEIKEQALRRITDEFVADAIRDESPDLSFIEDQSDRLLIELLRQARDGRLHTVVATLRRRQHQLITAPENQILVVEGPPGSGKTEIALHRVSYLLYQSRAASSPQAKRILVLGPNRLFMHYASGVLSELGERNISQRAFDEWIYELLDSSFEFEPQHLSLETLLDPATSKHVKTMRYRNAVHKSSRDMVRLLDNYIGLLASEILEGKGDLVGEAFTPQGTRIEARLSPGQISQRLNRRAIADLPFNQRREALEARLAGELHRQLNDEYKRSVRLMSESDERRIRDQVARQVHSYFDSWRSLNVSVAYRRLLRNQHLLHAAGAGVFSEWDLELLMLDAPTAQTPFRYSDLPALLYLKILLDGLPGRQYDHIVMDEAQDVTPLQFELLTRFCPQKHMTVMGDMMQGIFAHHGVRDWQQLFATEDYNLQQIPNSYRSTKQINEYANQLLARVGFAKDRLIDSVSRDGPQPVQRGFVSLSDWASAFQDVLQEAKARGWETVAIICKSLTSCRRIQHALTNAGVGHVEIIANAETDEIGSLVIIPLHLAKGLEFDVVVLADIDEETYPADTLHARLLYVGITRAAHQLVVNWVGRPSPLLESSTPVIDLAEPFAQVMEPNPVTIADFVSSHPNLEPAWCVERLARREKLNLLRNGRIDQTVAAMLLGTDEKEPRRTSRGLIQPLDIQTRSTITERVRSLNFERKTQSGLALTQLTFSLLRHQMRSLGLTLDGEAENTLEDQVVALCTFQQYLDGDSSGLTPGRWTTERTVLELVLKNRREQALIFLNMLIDFGIVERSNEQIRVRSDQIGELLVLALGGTAANWDPDLIAQLSMPPQLNASATEPAGTSHGD